MKISEVIVEEQLDEIDWKKPLATAAAAATIAGPWGYQSLTKHSEPTVATQQIQQTQQTQQLPQTVEPEVKQNPLDLVAPASPRQIQKMLSRPMGKYLYEYATKSGMQGAELAQFMGQAAHETQGFTHLRETGGRLDFKKYEPVFKKDKRGKLILDPETNKPKDFNQLSKTLGNTQVGDGNRYIGRGFLHLTGRWNYDAASRALGIDLVKHPELVETNPEVAAKVALWFWQNRVQRRMRGTDYSDTPDVTRPINRGDAIERRHSMYRGFDQALDKK